MVFAISIPINKWTPQLRSVLGSLKSQSVETEIAVMMTRQDPRILKDLKDSGLNISYSRVGPDDGQAAAINEGWSNTKNPLLAWLNTDDALTHNALSSVSTAFKNDSSLGALYGQSTISDENNDIYGLHPAVQPISPLIRRTNIISQPSCFVRRQSVEAIGGINVDLHYTMDWDLWLRLFENKTKFKFSDQVYSNVTWNSQTKTASLSHRRLYEFSKILYRTQNLYKTSIGLFSLIRDTKQTYKSESYFSIAKYCNPLIAINDNINFPVINMHRESKLNLHVEYYGNIDNVNSSSHDFKKTQLGSKIILKFNSPINPGESANINISGKNINIYKCLWH